VLAALAGCLACASGPPLRIAPVSDPPTQLLQPGRFVWVDLVTHDVAGAKAFYGALFGWSFDGDERGYVRVLADGRPIAGIVDVERPEGWERETGWIGSLSVEDVDRAARIVAERGGAVERGPLDAEGRGRMALVRDPAGAHLLLLRSASGDPPDGLAPPRRFLWRELWTRDVEEALGFYAALAGYQARALDRGGRSYRVLAVQGVPRAGVVEAPPEVDPQWLPYVRVEDAAQIAERATALGARVVHRDERAAILIDPTGAPIGVQAWSEGR
jgi:predicted enzyme related to lactoylglutathione lyase